MRLRGDHAIYWNEDAPYTPGRVAGHCSLRPVCTGPRVVHVRSIFPMFAAARILAASTTVHSRRRAERHRHPLSRGARQAIPLPSFRQRHVSRGRCRCPSAARSSSSHGRRNRIAGPVDPAHDPVEPSKPSNPRTLEPSNTSNPRTLGTLEPRTFEPSNPRTFEPSNLRTFDSTELCRPTPRLLGISPRIAAASSSVSSAAVLTTANFARQPWVLKRRR
jgi:hypothetical protein